MFLRYLQDKCILKSICLKNSLYYESVLNQTTAIVNMACGPQYLFIPTYITLQTQNHTKSNILQTKCECWEICTKLCELEYSWEYQRIFCEV